MPSPSVAAVACNRIVSNQRSFLMVKPPKIRHSKSRREPMTIELGPDEISRIEESKGEAAPREPAEDGQAEQTAATADETTAVGDSSPAADSAPAEAAEQPAPVQNEP